MHDVHACISYIALYRCLYHIYAHDLYPYYYDYAHLVMNSTSVLEYR